METPEGGWRRPPEVIPAAFPPSDLLRRQPSVSLFLVLCFSAASSRKTLGDLLYRHFLGHEDASGRRIDANGAIRAEIGGPTRPGTVAAWGTIFWPSGLRSLSSFAPRSSSFQKNDPRKFISHYDVVKALKQIRKEIGVFCLRMINSIKRGNHY